MAVIDLVDFPEEFTEHKDFIESYLDDILQQNLSAHKYSKLNVDVIFRDLVIQQGIEKAPLYGLCQWEDTHYRPSDFTVTVNTNQSFKGIVNTLGHEFCHVVQMASGKLYQMINTSKKKKLKYTYQKKVYEPWKMEYRTLPWEIEAFGCSLLYILDYCNKHDIDPSTYVPDDLLFKYRSFGRRSGTNKFKISSKTG